jgi:hypothetical protein
MSMWDGAAHAPVWPQPSLSAPHAPTEPMRSDRADRSRTCPNSRDSAIFRYCSVILQYRLLFYYNKLSYFARVNSAILLDILMILAQSFYVKSAIFCYRAQSFHVATALSHSLLLSAQPFLVLQCSVIPRYSVLSHFTL